MFRGWKTPLLGAALAALLVISVASPTFAYGKANYQITFSGTGTAPGVGGTGFWGWCDLAGGGTSGDCQVTQYNHGGLVPAGQPAFTCHENIDISA
jgi:hypothetical protein